MISTKFVNDTYTQVIIFTEMKQGHWDKQLEQDILERQEEDYFNGEP